MSEKGGREFKRMSDKGTGVRVEPGHRLRCENVLARTSINELTTLTILLLLTCVFRKVPSTRALPF